MHYGLNNRRVLVTGGTHGIGLACARALQAEGAMVTVTGRYPKGLEAAFEEGFNTYQFDVLGIKDPLPPNADILINNVGGGGRWGQEMWPGEVQWQTWAEVMLKNLRAMQWFTSAALPYMVSKKWGRVITISSILGKEAGGRPWFAAAKAAEVAAMKAFSQRPEYSRSSITFNTVSPGAIYIEDTGWDKEPEKLEALRESIPGGRLGTSGEVAAVVTFLCSDAASWVNGANIVVDGGESKSF